MEATTNYGPINKEQSYRIIDEGFDWYLVKARGHVMQVPKWVFERKRNAEN